jgi:hypothetical protein
MIKAVEIIEIEPYYVICKFSDASKRKLYIEPLFANKTNTYSAQQVLNQQNFIKAKIGDLGQLYWNNAAQIIDYNGKAIDCEFDISPEFVFYSSVPC